MVWYGMVWYYNLYQVLTQKTKLKIRSGVAFRDFMVVDSPGMIDR